MTYSEFVGAVTCALITIAIITFMMTWEKYHPVNPDAWEVNNGQWMQTK